MRENEKVTSLLRNKAESVAAGAQLLMSKTRDWQVIKQYLSNRISEFELTYDQQRKLERYQFIYNQMVSARYSKIEVINQVMKLHGVSLQQVYDDINCTQEIFSTVVNINKQFELQLQLEIAKDMHRKCMEVNDMKNASLAQKNIVAILSFMPDEDSAPGEDFEGHTIEAVFDPRLLGGPDIDMKEVLAAVNAKRKVPIKIDMFEELNYDQPKDEETTAL